MTSTVLYNYNGDILDLIGWFSIIFMPTAHMYNMGISHVFLHFFLPFLPLASSHSAPKVYMEKLQKLLVHAAKHGPLEPAEILGWGVLVELNLLLQIIRDTIYIYTCYII